MAVHLNTIPAQAGEVMRALIEVESGNDSNAWWLDARQNPATQGAVVAGSMAVAGVPGAAITRWRYRWGGVNNLLLNKSGGGGGMSDWVASGGILHDKFLLIAQDDIDPAIDAQIAFADFTAAGGSYCRIPITSADIVKLARLTNNFNLLNLVISDEPGSGPVPPPPPVTRDTSGDVESGAPVVSAGAEAVRRSRLRYVTPMRRLRWARLALTQTRHASSLATRIQAATCGPVLPGYQPMPKSCLRATADTSGNGRGGCASAYGHALKRSA